MASPPRSSLTSQTYLASTFLLFLSRPWITLVPRLPAPMSASTTLSLAPFTPSWVRADIVIPTTAAPAMPLPELARNSLRVIAFIGFSILADLHSSLNYESCIGPVGEILARTVAGIHRDEADHLRALGNLHIEAPRRRLDAHDGARGGLLAVDEHLEDEAGILRQVRAVADADQVLVCPGQRDEVLVLGLERVHQFAGRIDDQ